MTVRIAGHIIVRALARSRWLLGAALILATLLLLGSTALGAQVIRGTVVDRVSLGTVDGAGVWLLDATGRPVGTGAVSDDSGRFAIQLPRAGNFRLRVARIGYGPETTDAIAVEVGRTVLVQVFMQQRPVSLGAVEITERTTMRGTGALDGFEMRRLRGLGKFVTRADIEQMAPVVFLDIIAGIPGVRILHVSQGRQIVRMNRSAPMLRSSARRVEANEAMDDEGIVAENNCPVIFFLDGVRLNNSGDASLDRVEVVYHLPVELIEGIEIYRGAAELPAEFGGSDARCGVVAVWTRRGR